MGKYLGLLLAFAMIFVGGFGYVYFGPPQHTRFVSRTLIYRNHIAPFLDEIFLPSTKNKVSVGYLLESRGDLSYRPSSELVFLPARDGQRFFGGTLVSTGPKSIGKITLIDETEIILEENTTLLLEIPQDFETGAVLDLQLVSGSITAEQKKPTKVRVNVIDSRGSVQPLRKEKLSVVSPKIESLQNESGNDTLIAPPPSFSASSNPGTIAGQNGLEILQTELNASPSSPDFKPLDISGLQSSDTSLSLEGLSPEPILPPKDLEQSFAPKATPEVRYPASIDPRLVLPSAPQKVVRIREFQIPPEGNDLSRALFFANKGNRFEAQKSLASVVTRSDYFGKKLTPTTKLALEGILENYLANKECDQANYLLSNVSQNYGKDETASKWIRSQKVRAFKSCEAK